MASALPEGQEALELESACSENTPVGGQAHPISSNTTQVSHSYMVRGTIHLAVLI
jgi:hypothetical protein